jgi:hypothetical protein
MILKITGISDDKLGTHDAKRIDGTRVDNGEEWSKKFFANNKELRQELDEFGVGDNVNIKLKQDPKNKNFWDIVSFSAVSAEMVESVKGSGKNSSGPSSPRSSGGGGGGGKKSNLTKEEWAEKDRQAKIGYSIHNSIAAAAQVCKVGTTPEKLVEYAKQLLPYLMLTEIPDDGSDPLDPPVDED